MDVDLQAKQQELNNVLAIEQGSSNLVTSLKDMDSLFDHFTDALNESNTIIHKWTQLFHRTAMRQGEPDEVVTMPVDPQY